MLIRTRQKISKIIRVIRSSPQSVYYKYLYSSELKAIRQRHAVKTIAVVIHLFYTDNWELFKNKLQNLPQEHFDLYITMPKSNVHFIDEIQKTYPEASVIQVPNRGRDVLPFIKLAKVLSDIGYEAVLKFHSKKSTHWEGGQDWLEGMLERLLPNNIEIINDTLTALSKPDTGIIGPGDVYYPLDINFPANGVHMTAVTQELYDKHTAYDVLQLNRSSYGFFGGTMFWARLDAIEPLLKYGVSRFEKEDGQVDGTFAHALERLFCIIPEIEKKQMFELNLNGLKSIGYKSSNVPPWSQKYE